MNRIEIINKIGIEYHTTNMENGEYSYVREAGSKENLEKAVGHKISHFVLDIRFEKNDIVILVETKKNFVKKDEKQLAAYLEEERALHKEKKIIGILANTNNDKIKVWKSNINKECELIEETVLDTMQYYERFFAINKQNDREKVLKNTYSLNELLHKMDIDEKLRSQFVGTSLLYLKDIMKKMEVNVIDDALKNKLDNIWKLMDEKAIRADIEATLSNLLDGSENKTKKIELLQKMY